MLKHMAARVRVGKTFGVALQEAKNVLHLTFVGDLSQWCAEVPSSEPVQLFSIQAPNTWNQLMEPVTGTKG